ncbi:MAG: ankyrin repeat domain-containing protein [Steroidobacteraceae bacterium]
MRYRALAVLAVALGGALGNGLACAQSSAPVVEPIEKVAPLVIAARDNDAKTVLALLAARPGPDVNQRTADGTSALHWAVHHGDSALVARLLAAGADGNAHNDYGASPMSEAAIRGDSQVMRALLSAGASVESANADGQTALMILARTSNTPAAQLLISHGANVNAHEKWRNQSALMWAAAQAQPAMVHLLLQHGAVVDDRSLVNDWAREVTAEPRMQARPSGGLTPLLYAARAGCLECAQLLIKAGADPNLGDPDGVSALLESTLNFHFDIAAFLVKRGADVDHWDTWGRSALYAAVDLDALPVGGRADRPSLDQTSSLQLIRILLEAGANPNLQLKLFPPYRSLRDDRGADAILTVGATPLLRAAKGGDLPAIQLLLAHGANVELPTSTGISPLLAAAGVGSSPLDTRGRYKTQPQAVTAVQALLAGGANVNETDHSGQTALHGAASWGWNDLVKTLADHHANLLAKDGRGRTAADVAMGSASNSGRASAEAHPETAALLRQLMANAAQPTARNAP